MEASPANQIDWDDVLSASSDEDTAANDEITEWQRGFWLGDTESTDNGEDEVDSPLLIEGVGILCSLPKAVPDGRSILMDDELPTEVERTKSYYVAREIMTSERSYLKGLHLIEKAFHGAINMHNANIKEIVPEGALRLIFSNIGAIYELSLEMLIQLEQRLEEWIENPVIADIFITRAPFLKMYSLYSGDFERSQATLSEWMKKSPQLVNIVKIIEDSRFSCGLTIPSYMLYPIQRVPRYRLLLQNYLSTLKESNPDYDNTKKALVLIEEVATHMENQIDRLANFHTVVKIQRTLCGKGAGTVVQPGREFLLKAPAKQAKRRGGLKQRVLFLFSDILVITHASQTFGSNYKISNIVQLRDVTVNVAPAKQLKESHTFSITASGRPYVFAVGTEAEKVKWVKGIQQASSTETEKRTTFLREYSRTSASHLSVLLNDPDILSELRKLAGPEVEVTHHLPSLQARIRSKLASLGGTSSYSPSVTRKSPHGARPTITLLSTVPAHISETGLVDATALGLSARKARDGADKDTARNVTPDGDTSDGGYEEVDFGETLLAPFSDYIWVRRYSPDASPWQQMWCQLCGLWIYCFDDHRVNRQPFGCIALAGYRLCETSIPMCFGLRHPVKPTFELRFETYHEFNRWVVLLSRDLDKYLLEEVLTTIEV